MVDATSKKEYAKRLEII